MKKTVFYRKGNGKILHENYLSDIIKKFNLTWSKTELINLLKGDRTRIEVYSDKCQRIVISNNHDNLL